MTEPTHPLVPADFTVPAGLETELFVLEHVTQFADRARFAYPVLDPGSAEVIGCLYIGSSDRDGHDADVRSWTRADRAHLDRPRYDAVSRWLSDAWPFHHPGYAAR